MRAIIINTRGIKFFNLIFFLLFVQLNTYLLAQQGPLPTDHNYVQDACPELGVHAYVYSNPNSPLKLWVYCPACEESTYANGDEIHQCYQVDYPFRTLTEVEQGKCSICFSVVVISSSNAILTIASLQKRYLVANYYPETSIDGVDNVYVFDLIEELEWE